MNVVVRSSLFGPLVLAAIFLVIVILLMITNPGSFWTGTDYETLGLADALNLAYRIADWKMYVPNGMTNHPGVPFYLMSWVALALTGYPVASRDPNFFTLVIAQVEEYHQIVTYLAALTGAAGIYVFARAARNLVPFAVTAAALMVWLISTPATLQSFTSAGIDAFAILINALFVMVMVSLAYSEKIDVRTIVFAGLVGALAYLNKLSYIYIPLALYAALLLKLILCRAGWRRGTIILFGFVATFLVAVIAAGFLIIGREGFHQLREFHKSVFWGSGLYGTGGQTVVSEDEVWRAISAIPADRAFALPIALVAGVTLPLLGVVSALKRIAQIPVAIMSVGAGVAAALSALFVVKHYALHYTAGISATLPFCVLCFYLISKSWDFRLRYTGYVLAFIAVVFMAVPVTKSVLYVLADRANRSRLAQLDLVDINAQLAELGVVVEFAYKAPFAQCGEGFIINYASVPRLTQAYLQSRPGTTSSIIAGMTPRDVGAYVIDKGYFPNEESVKSSDNFALLDPKPAKFEAGDKLIELRTVFLLIRGKH